MPIDHHPLSLTSPIPDAIQQLNQGIDGIIRWHADALSRVEAAIAADPNFAMAHAIKGLFMAGGRNRRFQTAIDTSLRQARVGQTELTHREHGYIDALAALAHGQIHRAILQYEQILLQHPTDLLAHRLVQQELFWIGETRWMRDIVARARPAWTPDHPQYSSFLSVFAFSHEEAGEHDKAERAGREAVDRDPFDCWGAHAVTHVLEMQGRHKEGINWLEGLCNNWSQANQIAHHLWWHLCLFYLEQPDYEHILELLDQHVRNPASPLVQAAPDAYIDIQNVASLLLRLELRGVEVGSRWQTVAEVAAQRINNHPSPFTSAHAVLILAACGRFDKAETLLQSLHGAAADSGTLASRINVAAIPASSAAISHYRSDYDQVIQALMPARHDLWQMGGSHAQRDIFWQLLTYACMQRNRTDYLRILLDEMRTIGFSHADERSLYQSAAAMIHAEN